MAKRFIDPEVAKILNNMKLFEAHKNKTCDYTLEDFIIEKNKWRHKTWKCWMRGTKRTVIKYIKECNKPWEERNLSEFHLAED